MPDPDLEIRRGGVSKNIFPQFGLKIRGGRPPAPPPLDLPLEGHMIIMIKVDASIFREKSKPAFSWYVDVNDLWFLVRNSDFLIKAKYCLLPISNLNRRL